MDLVVDAIRQRTNKPLRQFIIQECGGTIATMEQAVRAAREMVEEASLLKRSVFPHQRADSGHGVRADRI
jgi:altronate dehydratase large subunit